MATLSVQSAAAFSLDAILPILFHRLPADHRRDSMARARTMIATGEMPLSGIMVACVDDEPIGAMFGSPAPGAVGSVWPPQVLPGPLQEAAADALVQATVCWLQKEGATMCQAVLPTTEVPNAAALERNGFDHVMQLLFLRHSLEPEPFASSLRHPLEFQSHAAENHTQLGATLLRTYEGSLDCPELNDKRTLEEIIVGHYGEGGPAHAKWWLVKAEGQAVGVLLLNQLPDECTWEVSYMGLVPEARRRGFGRQLMHKALAEVRASGGTTLILSVDARNQPAIQLYLQLGFEIYDEREVYLRILAAPGEIR